MHICFIDTEDSWKRMLPLSYTRPVSDVRVGIKKIHEKWGLLLPVKSFSFRSQKYLIDLFPSPKEKTLTLLGNVLPNETIIKAIENLKEDACLSYEGQLIAGYFEPHKPFEVGNRTIIELGKIEQVHYPWDLFQMNSTELERDFVRVTQGRKSQPIHDLHTKIYGTQIFLEEGAKVKAAILNAENGPIYIGKNAEIQEGALIRGPFAMCEHATVNMGAKIKNATTIGPYTKIGGEVSNSIIFGYANKGHDGFLGNSVIGEWCNLGANTNVSNLKNNYTNIKMWDFESNKFKETGFQFCGLIMGDHSKSGINTMFNTGTSVGVAANIYGDGFPPTYIPSFAWGGSTRLKTYQLEKSFETFQLVMQRRNKTLSEAHKEMFSSIFDNTSKDRNWENNK